MLDYELAQAVLAAHAPADPARRTPWEQAAVDGRFAAAADRGVDFLLDRAGDRRWDLVGRAVDLLQEAYAARR